MTVTITSTTDSAEAVAAATGSMVQGQVEEKSASAEKADETANESEPLESSEEKDEKDGEESEEESESKEADDKPKKSGKGFKKRIDKLNQKLSAKDQELEYWKSKALLEQKNDAQKADRTAPEANAGTSGEPNADDFASHAEYIAALTDWKVEQKLSERDKKAREKEMVSAHEKTVTTFTEKVQSFAKKHEDFQELMEEVDDVPMSIAIQEGIFASDKGPELMYELAKNRDEYARLCALPYNAALVELGKFEAKLSSSADQKTETAKKQSKAPPPINPVKSKGAGASMKSPDDMDFQEYKKWRSANA